MNNSVGDMCVVYCGTKDGDEANTGVMDSDVVDKCVEDSSRGRWCNWTVV